MAPLRAQTPTGTVRGRVVDDATKEPLVGVSITLGARGARTASDGHFIVTAVPAGTDTLRVRMLGYAPAKVAVTAVDGQTVIVPDIALTQQAVSLSEIVVVGYGQQTAGDITGAVKQLATEDFNPGNIVTPQQLIANRIAGVEVVDNNDVGGGMAVRIRGATSINASSDPLYVIDGMPVGSGGLSAGRDPLNFINPNDIESITVLKDASAAAIYGANAANGVVIITTKSKRAGSVAGQGAQLEYSSSFSAASATKLESVLNSAQFRAALTSQNDTVQLNRIGNANTNWFNQILRTGYGQEHNLTVSGASPTSGYRLSFGLYNQKGVVQTLSTQRLSLGFNYDQRMFGDRLDIRTAIKGSRTIDGFDPGGMMGNAAQFAPTQPVFDSTAKTGFYDWPGNPLTATNNPLEIANLSQSQGFTYRSLGNLQADYQLPFIDGLKASVNFGYDLTQITSQFFAPNNLDTQLKNGALGTWFRSNNYQLNTLGEAYLNYSAPLNFIPGKIDATGGYSYSTVHSEFPSLNLDSLSATALGFNSIPTFRTSTARPGMGVQDSKLISFFGRVNYNLNDRYLIAASLRRDGSSRFASTNAWGNFPSVSVAWRLSQESFLRDIRALSDLKIRAAWATTGNQSFQDYLQYTTFTLGDAQSAVQFGNSFVPTLRPSAVNPDIKWESTASWNVGADFGFFNQRISGSIDWYVKKTSDLIFSTPIVAGTNMSNFLTQNIGSMRNTGIELSLSAQIMRGDRHSLGWTADFTASHNSNTLTSISASGAYQILVGGIQGGVGQTIEVLQAGRPINSFYVYQQKYANGKPLEGQYVDQNNDGVINSADLRPFHDPAPKWIFGHTSNFTFENFDLSFTVRAWLGNYVYNNVASANGYYARFTDGQYPVNLDASVLTTGFLTTQKFSDYYVQDGSFLRMDNIALGYTFRYRGSQLRLFASVQNVFTITGYKGVDPTAGLNGIDNNLFPRSRTVTGGLSVKL
jgi:iron complex outermembrane receptor protein